MRSAAPPGDGTAQRSPYIPLPAGLSDPRRLAGEVFDRIAALYDRARPGYPAEAVGELFRTAGIDGSSRVLEIGPGSGQLTRHLAASGAFILAVEPGASLVARCRANIADSPNVEILVARFEDVGGLPATFDLVVAATSFHWVDSDIAYRKAANVLRPGGSLALLTNAHAAGGTHNDERFAREVRGLHCRFAPNIGQWSFPVAEEIEQRAALGKSLAAVWARVERSLEQVPDVSGIFAPPRVNCYQWLATYERDSYLDMLASQSSYALLASEERSALMDEIGKVIDDVLGGLVTKEYVTVLAIAERR